MDDLWGNAWSRPDENITSKVTQTTESQTLSWKLPVTSIKNEEADIGQPSWTSGPINWAEPSGEASLWTSEVAADKIQLETSGNGWGGSGIGLDHGFSEEEEMGNVYGKKEEVESSEEPEERQERIASPAEETHASYEIPAHGEESEETPIAEFQELPVMQEDEVEVKLDNDRGLKSSDLFGSFEDGLAVDLQDDDAWGTPAVPPDDDTNAWGSPWGAHPDKEDSEPPKDEWEAAKQEKSRRDRAVPPDLIASILNGFNELAVELWPEPVRTDSPALEFGNWRDGMENVPGLKELIEQALPGTMFQPPIQFSRSHIAKSMATSVKLSKNLPVVRQSPMSHLFTAKSSTAWELSVKSKVETPKDDIPAGWRTVELEQVKEQKPQAAEKRTGGFLSFLNRRTSTVPTISSASTTSQSRERSSSPAPSRTSVSSSAPTRESVETQPSAEKMQSSLSLTSLASDAPAPALASSASLPSSLSSMPSSSNTNSSAQGLEPTSGPSSPTPAAAPSAVSRFFNRFSRTAKTDSRRSSSSTRSSIALSTDDIEFLSDIVPSHGDDGDDDDQLASLTAMVSSPALMLPNKLPPPLAPPPRSNSVASMSSVQTQPSGSRPTSIFNDFEALSPSLSNSPQTNLPPPLPPPLSPTSLASISKPPTPSPLGDGHNRTSSRSSIPGIASPPSRTRTPNLDPLAGLGLSRPSVIQSTPTSQPSPLPPILPPTTSSNLAQHSSDVSTNLGISMVPRPVAKSPGRVYAQTNTRPFFKDDDGEFAGFDSLPPFGSQAPSVTSGPSSVSASDVTLSEVHGEDEFGDFGDFISTTSPSAPTPPNLNSSLSPQTPSVPPPPPRKHLPTNIKTHVRRPSAADHQATADLVERAAARKGRWPAPPSPIPERLSPPPPPSSVARSLSPPMSSITLKPIAQITSSSRSSTPPIGSTSKTSLISPPALLPPPSFSGQLAPPIPSLLDLDSSLDSKASPSAPIPTMQDATPPNKPAFKPAVPSSQGGLSAQDLSFFEGL